jgi:hypothetical protein
MNESNAPECAQFAASTLWERGEKYSNFGFRVNGF